MSVDNAPALDFRIFGNVSDEFVGEVKEALRSTYDAISRAKPDIVAVRVVDGLVNLKELCEEEQGETGGDAFGGEGYLTTHEWIEGSSRITICWQRADELPPLIGQAALQHEAGHSVLHGGEEFGAFSLTEGLLRRGRKAGLRIPAMRALLYLSSQAVKDFEVSRLLAMAGLRSSQTALAVYQFAEQVRERPGWKEIASSAEGRLVYLASHLRPLLYTEPLQATDSNLSEISRAIGETFAPVPEDIREDLIALSASLAENLGEDTFESAPQTMEFLLDRFGADPDA